MHLLGLPECISQEKPRRCRGDADLLRADGADQLVDYKLGLIAPGRTFGFADVFVSCRGSRAVPICRVIFKHNPYGVWRFN